MWGETGIGRMFTLRLAVKSRGSFPQRSCLESRTLADATGIAYRWDLHCLPRMGWLVTITAPTFSFMQGIFHAYYTVALAPLSEPRRHRVGPPGERRRSVAAGAVMASTS